MLAFLVLAACNGGKTAIDDVTAEVSPAMPTVITVSWVTAADADQVVEYGTTEDFGYEVASPAGSGTERSAVLLGLPPEADVYLRVREGDLATETTSIRTGALSGDLPVLSVEGESDRFILTTLLGANVGPTIIDPQGRVVWFHPEPRDLDVYRMRISRDREWILYNAASVSGDPATDSALVKVSLDGTRVEEVAIPLLAHDFVELPDGTITVMAVEYRELDGEQIRGDQLIEIAPDGTESVAWSAWDCFDPAVDIGTDSEQGWTFANALDYHEGDDAYYLSLRNFSSIVKIDRATGTCPWVFGSTAATVTPAEGSAVFLHEHQFEIHDDSILVFDNDGAEGNVSRVLEFAYDGGTTATETWEYIADPSVYTFVLGEPVRLDDGDTMIDWAVNGQIDRVTADGTLEWQLKTGLGYAFGFMGVTTQP